MKTLTLKNCFLTLFILAFSSFFSFANNIRLRNVSLVDTVKSSKQVNIKFDLSWENSWRDEINWDAAWITVKVKRANGSWKHIKLRASGLGVNPQSAKVVVPEDQMGAFIYRSGNGSGNIEVKDVKFSWNYGLDSIANIDSAEVRVFATEMVYIPKGNFAFGDAYTPSQNNLMAGGNNRILPEIFKNFLISDTSKFGQNTPMFSIISDKNTPKLIPTGSGPSMTNNTELANGIFINGAKGIAIDESGSYKYPDFPTGYNAFYCMKYEVTQGQYTDFLNTTRVIAPTGSFTPMFNQMLLPTSTNPRFTILKTGDNYTVSRPDRAIENINLNHIHAFANWSSLRPMSELEFEKAARGPIAPTPGDRANGGFPRFNTPMDHMNKVINSLKINGSENGTEVPLGVDSTKFLNIWNGSTIEGGDGGSGPYRVGVFATATSSRSSSGASYYGVMGLSDNVPESVVSINSNVSRSFKSAHGIGENTSNGSSVISHWYGNAFPSNWEDIILKFSSVSDRNTGSQSGFRLVRSAPADTSSEN
jgi:hypothetical protein